MGKDIQKNKRIGYIDSLKGLAMMMVLMGHVLGFCTTGFDNAIIRNIVLINMPLFFFLNGLVIKSIKNGSRYLLTKCRQILLPFFAWGVIITLFRDSSYFSFLASLYKFGYWYLLVFFYYIIIYFIIEIADHKINPRHKFIVTISEYIIAYLICRFIRRFVSADINDFICYSLFFECLPYFFMGIAIQRLVHMDIWKNHINLVNNSALLLAIGCYVLWNHYIGGELVLVVLRASLIVCIYQIFVAYSHSANKGIKIINDQLALIGRHTLAIYMIQYYFFRYINLNSVGLTLLDDNNWIGLLIIVIIVSILICYACMAIEKIILISPLARFALLGKSFSNNIK